MADKVAVVTGGAGGIGQAVVARLAQSGCGVCIVDQNEKAGQELVELMRQKNHQVQFHRVDLRDAAEIKKVFANIHAKSRRSDVLVNLAGARSTNIRSVNSAGRVARRDRCQPKGDLSLFAGRVQTNARS